MNKSEIAISFHSIERYYERIHKDKNRKKRNEKEIEDILLSSLFNSPFIKKIYPQTHYLINLRNQNTNEEYGLIYILIEEQINQKGLEIVTLFPANKIDYNNENNHGKHPKNRFERKKLNEKYKKLKEERYCA